MTDKSKKVEIDNRWEKRYQDLLDSLNIGFTLIDRNNSYLDVNKTYLKMTGFTRDQIVGRHISEFLSEAENKKFEKIISQHRSVQNYQFEFVLAKANGDRFPVLQNIHKNVDKNGRNVFVYALVTDIRKQKKIQTRLKKANTALKKINDTLEMEKKKLEAILFGIGDCVTIFDKDGKLLLSNKKGLEIRGHHKEPFLPLSTGIKKQIELTIEKEPRRFLSQMQEIQDQNGAVSAYVETLNDITPQLMLKEKENELSRVMREIQRSQLKSTMIGISRPMEKVFELIMRCAEVDSTVLILGDTGVGKEVAARAIHENSNRKNKPFVAVNCGALPETLLESELFGHVKGAFTGAHTTRLGLFREASGGTLFLDEIGELISPLQVKLLRVLQDKEIRPVGGDRSYPTNVRVLCATNDNIEESVKQKRFRRDLYYRIAVIPLHIPSLRERKEDIIPLSEHFLKKYRKKGKKFTKSLNQEVQQFLLDWPWPGNVRELENTIEHCIAMSRESTITIECLPVKFFSDHQHEKFTPKISEQSLNEKAASDNALVSKAQPINLHESEKQNIFNSLILHKGNRSRAAKQLGISRSTILRKIKMYEISL